MAGYTKLFSTIITSTIWREPKEAKILWITMLALADKDGMVEGSVPGIAAMAGLTVPETLESLKILQAPDEFSRSKDEQGRRILAIEGGWFLVNHAKYREMLNSDDRREYFRQKQAEFRARRKGESTNVNTVFHKSTESTHAEATTTAEASADKGTKVPLNLPSRVDGSAAPALKAPKPRDPLFDALAVACGNNLSEMTALAQRACGVALAAIRKVMPGVTVDDFPARVAVYRRLYRDAACTPMAINKHWGELGPIPKGAAPGEKPARLTEETRPKITTETKF